MKSKIVNSKRRETGQALVVLLFYMIVAIIITTTAVALAISNSLTTMQEEEGNHALEIAESGAENALIRLLRDINYTGEILTVNGGNATVSVSGAATKTVTSAGVVGNFSRTVQIEVLITDGVLSVLSWVEL